jgi:hypothetical protein
MILEGKKNSSWSGEQNQVAQNLSLAKAKNKYRISDPKIIVMPEVKQGIVRTCMAKGFKEDLE